MLLALTPQEVFSLTGPPVLIGWAILILAPRNVPLLNSVPRIIIPFGLSALYAVLVLTHFSQPGGGYGSLDAVRQLFSSDWVLLAGWVHYLAFDLFVGSVLAVRMDRAGIGRLVQAPVLAATFMFGPVGLVLALGTEAALSSRPWAARLLPQSVQA